MAERKEKICRFCLNCDDDNFLKLEASFIGKVKAIIPELTLRFPSNTFVCSKCKAILDKSFELKRTFSKNCDAIQSLREKSNSAKIDLTKLVKTTNSNKDICRICLSVNGEFFNIDKDCSDDFGIVLDYCIPELDINLTTKPAMCFQCRTTLYEMYNFKKDCLSVEEKIQACYNSSSPEDIDLNKVLIFSKGDEENDFLSGFEVQDEEGTDIFDISNIPEENSRKRPVSEIVSKEVEHVKKPKYTDVEIVGEELPEYQFNTGLLFNPSKSDITLEDWLAKVEQYKQKFNWSDYTTIHKVLLKLKGMNELYIWFSNIADIMDWEQWKKKLIRAFPLKNDHHMILKKMILRKKRRDETYEAYYNDKVEVMKPLNLTPQQKVSCLFGGVSEVLVSCVGRVGDYKNPEEVLGYFKSCDDKHSVEAAAAAGPTKMVTPDSKQQKYKGNAQSSEKRKRKKCFNCSRYGHTSEECRGDKVGSNKINQQNMLPQPQVVKQPRRPRIRPKCTKCGKMGHTQAVCLNKNNVNKSLQQKQTPKKQKDPRCSSCHEVGHMAVNCFQEWSKKLDKRKNDNSRGNQRRNAGNNAMSRCQKCGKFSSNGNQCCTAKTYNGSYIGSYSQGGSQNKEICLKCYKTGHPTKNCEQFYRKPFRN